MSWGSPPDQVTQDVDLAERGEVSRHQSEVLQDDVYFAERGESSRHQHEETTDTASDPEVLPPALRRDVRQVSLMGDVRHRIGDLQSAAGVDTQQVASPQHPTSLKLPEGTSMTTRSAAAAATALRWSDVDNVKKDAEQPRFRFGFRSSIIGAIFLAVLLSCGGMYSVLFVSTTRISQDTRESCSRAVEVQDELISRLVYRNVTLESYSSILTNMSTMVTQCVQEPSNKAVDALWNAMRTWRRFGNPVTGNSSALKREEVEYLTWASLTSQWELPTTPVLSRQSWLMSQPHVDSISVSFLSGQYTGAQYTFGTWHQGPHVGMFDFPVAHALDKAAGDKTVLGWQLTEDGNRIEPAWSYTPYDPRTRPYFTVQQSIYDRAAAGPGGAASVAATRAWSKVYKYTSGKQTGMSWTSPVAYCGNYSCFEGVVSADVTLEHVDAELTERWTELEEELRTEFNFKISPENASLFIVHHVCGHTPSQAGLLIGASHESLSIPDNNLTLATESPQEVVRTTAKAIQARFVNWSSPELMKSGMQDFTYRVGGILQDPPQVIDCEPEVVTADIDPLCRRVATLPVALDEHTQWLVVVVLPVGAFTEKAHASSTKAQSQVAQISNMSKDRVMEARIIGFCICGGMLVLSMFVGFFLGSMVSWPLQKLSKLMRLLGELDFAHRSLEWTELRKGRRSRVKDIDRLQNTFWNLSRGIEAFAHFVPETVVRNIVRGDPRSTRLHVSRREVTVMFSDIKDFTAISESLSQRDLLFVLTRYLSVMTNIVEMFEGVVAEVLGDGLLVFWNTPDDVQDHAAKACAAALAMQEAVVLLNVELESLSLLPLAVRIGIHTGDVLSGNIGSVAKMKFGCLGDPVNTASRLEGLCKHYQVGIICSSATHDMFAGNSGLFCRRLDLVQLKGKTVPMTIYEVIGHSLDEDPSSRKMHIGSCVAASTANLVSPMPSDVSTPKAIAAAGRGCCMRLVRCGRRKLTESSSQLSIGSCGGASVVSGGLDVAREVCLHQAQDTIAPEQRLYAQSYEAALGAFQGGDFELSYDLLSRLAAENPDDHATRSLRDRAWANRNLSESELEQWTGVLCMDSK